MDAPVVIVGNISVGGSGKTPLVAYLVKLLQKHGYRPGIVSRGYGGQATGWPLAVSARSDPALVGDEPVLLARRCACPVVVAPDRVKAARQLLERYHCDIVVSDDGLQHYRLQRDIEIAVVDGVRRFGNGFCLPAGPLREMPERLRSVDFVVVNGAATGAETAMTLSGANAVNLGNPAKTRQLAEFAAMPVHAVAAIADPGRFFKSLRRYGIKCIEHPFPDHHHFTAGELDFPADAPILMTEKDAVKCIPFTHIGARAWYVPVDAELTAEFEARFVACLSQLKNIEGSGNGQETA